jgi:hypothetical protein
MSKTKHNPFGKKKPNFIEFSKLQQSYLNEVRTRQVKEFNDAIQVVYEELGIMDKVMKAPEGMYKLRVKDLSGLDVLPIRLHEGSPSPGISKDKSREDN